VKQNIKHFDIVINGGGLVGNSLALALSKMPYSIAIIEAYPPYDAQRNVLESRTIAISHGARRIYEGLQVWDALIPYATPIQQIHVSDRGHFGMTRIHARDQQMPALGYVLQIAEINRILQDSVAQCENIYRFCPATIKQAERQNNQPWQITLTSDHVQQITCDLLIAADGAQSSLRQQLGLDVDEKDYQQTALVSVVELSRSHKHIAYERFTAEGPIALLPMQKNLSAVIVTVNNDVLPQWQALTDTDFLSKLQACFGYRLGRFNAVGRRVAYPLKLTTAPEQALPQFLLIGNAAHTMHPIAAQSFNLSLRDVAVFAEVLQQHSKQATTLQNADFITTYLKARGRDQQRTVRFTDTLIEVFSQSHLRLPRNLAMTGLELMPPLKTLLGKYGAGTLGKLSRLARGLPL
jgi:2-octaprenyl-6-methoxyphenol hydroxylase